jgi:hypothetical protein
MPNLVHGQDPGGALRPIQVDDNGNLSVDLVSGVNVSTTTEIAAGTLIQTLQLSGSISSQNILQVAGTAVAADSGVSNAGTLRVVHVTDSAVSVRAISNTGVDIGDVDVLSIAAGDNNIGDMDVRQISGSVDSSEVSGIARQTNPTAVADAAAVKASFDDLGRQVITPYQVRDLVRTAYLSTSTGIETTLLAAVAGANLDCVQVVCANTSDAIVDIDFRSVTAGSVEFSVTVPADSTSGFIPAVPWPQVNTGNNWTADVAGADISNTVVNISALFVQNV